MIGRKLACSVRGCAPAARALSVLSGISEDLLVRCAHLYALFIYMHAY